MHCAVLLLSSKPPGHQLSSCLRQNNSCAALCPQHYVRRVAGRIFSDAFQSSCNIIMLCCSRCLRGSHQSVTAALLKKPMASAWGWCCLHMGMGGQGDPCHLYRVQGAHVAGIVTVCVGITVGLVASLCVCPYVCTSLGRGSDTGCGSMCHCVTMSAAQGKCHPMPVGAAGLLLLAIYLTLFWRRVNSLCSDVQLYCHQPINQ